MVVKSSIWPLYESLKFSGLEKFEQESLLRDVRITKIEWTAIDTICSLRFGFSNGTTTIQLGDRIKLRETFIFPKDIEIKKVAISVRGEQEYLESLTFWDENGNELVSIRGENVKGELKVLELGKYENINGIGANMCAKYVRGLGFYVWKLGLGVPLPEEEEEVKE